MTDTDRSSSREPSVAELEALAAYARQRLALYRRRVLLGRGELRRLAELERISDGATARMRRARARADLATRATPTDPSATTRGHHDDDPTR